MDPNLRTKCWADLRPREGAPPRTVETGDLWRAAMDPRGMSSFVLGTQCAGKIHIGIEPCPKAYGGTKKNIKKRNIWFLAGGTRSSGKTSINLRKSMPE